MSADEISEKAVLDMLGQANADLILKMLKACLDRQPRSDCSVRKADASGAEPDALIADMLDKIHLASLMLAG